MFLVSYIWLNIVLDTNLFVRYSSPHIREHWNGVEKIYVISMICFDLGLIYPRNLEFGMVCFVDTKYWSDPNKAPSQTGYVFIIGRKTNSGCDFLKSYIN